jgi:hypothetical protein
VTASQPSFVDGCPSRHSLVLGFLIHPWLFVGELFVRRIAYAIRLSRLGEDEGEGTFFGLAKSPFDW